MSPPEWEEIMNKPLVLAGSIDPTSQELSEGFMLRTISIMGACHHGEFIRVEVVNDLQQAWESDTSDPDNVKRYDALQALHSGYYQTFRLCDCDWVFCGFPYAD